MTVQSVTGPIDQQQLGVVLTHEHLFVGWPGWNLDPVPLDQKVVQRPLLVDRLRRAYDVGVRTMVDASPPELGRDLAFLGSISRETGINIIASTGFYHESWGMPVYLKMRSVDELTEILLADLESGADGIRPGAIKVASAGNEVGKHERKALAAAAAASTETGRPILTHASNPRVALDQARTLVAEGADPAAVQIGHCDSFGADDLIDILRLGVCVAFDQLIYLQKASLEQRVGTLKQLIEAGHGNQLTLSHDQIGILGGRQVPLAGCTSEFTYAFTDFLPAVGAAGLDDIAHQLTVTNPARWLTGAVPAARSAE